jgi:hypothetical protein
MNYGCDIFARRPLNKIRFIDNGRVVTKITEPKTPPPPIIYVPRRVVTSGSNFKSSSLTIRRPDVSSIATKN